MPDDLQRQIADWDGLAVVSRYDRETASWIFIQLHDDTLGPCTGGTRMKHYPELTDAVLDGQRLAAGMTHKWAAVDMPFGGGKAVIATPPRLEPRERRGLLRRYGRLLQSLGGAFQTGEDLGVTSDDMALVAEECEFIHGVDPQTGQKVDPSPYTAHAVLHGIRAACEVTFGSGGVANRTVLVQGVGHVGEALARGLSEQGATLLISDIDAAACERLSAALDVTIVPPEEVATTPCDVYAPCAIGATLTESTIPQLACRIVAGSANNQLASPTDAELLHERGIVYVPDYVINAGGAVAFALIDEVGPGEALLSRVEPIGERVRALLAEGLERNESPVHAARRLVERNLRR